MLYIYVCGMVIEIQGYIRISRHVKLYYKFVLGENGENKNECNQ